MIREESKEFYHALKEMEQQLNTTWVSRDTVYDTLQERGWTEGQIDDAEYQLFNEGMLEESRDAEAIRTTWRDPEDT